MSNVVLALIAAVTLVLLVGLALVTLAPPLQRLTYVLPAVRTVALLTAAAIYIAFVWSHT